MIAVIKGSGKGKVIPKKATTFKLRQSDLENDQWAVHTNDEILLSKIHDELAKTGKSDCSDGHINHIGRGELPVIFVPFYIVKFIKDNKHNHPNYIFFHRKPRSCSGNSSKYGLWRVWMEGNKTPNAFLKKYFENWGNK